MSFNAPGSATSECEKNESAFKFLDAWLCRVLTMLSSYLLERIMELESPHANGSSSSLQIPAPQPSSSALPRNLLNARARTSFVENLRQAIAEDDADDDVYPVLSSRHVGPEVRRREEEERREHLEEEAREYRKGSRSSRASRPEANIHKGKESSGSSTSQSMMNYTPHQGDQSVSPRHSSSPVMSGTSTRLRVKSPASSPSHSDRVASPVTHNAIASSSSLRGQHQQSPSHSHPHSYTISPSQPPSPFQQSQHQSQPPLHHIPRSQSPESHPRSPNNGPTLQNTPNSTQDHAYEAGDREQPPRDIHNEPNSFELGTNPAPPRRGTRSRRNNKDSNHENVEDQGTSPRPTSQAARRVSSRNASRATRSGKAAAAKAAEAESQREPTLQSPDQPTSPAHVENSSGSVGVSPSSPPFAVQEDHIMDFQIGDEAQPKIVSGIEQVPDTVSATFGSAHILSPSLVHESPQRSPSPADPPPPSASAASTDAPSPSPTVDATMDAAATQPTSPAEVEASISPPSLTPATGSTSVRTAEDTSQASTVEGLAQVSEELHNDVVQAAPKDTIEQISTEVIRETMNKTSVEAHPTLTLDIVKVAEAAIAAQNAAKQSANNSVSPPLDPNIDPNLDPSLYAGSLSSATVGTSISTKDQGPSVAQASSSTSTSTTPSTPSSNLSGNPYLSLSTAMMSKMHGSPTGVPVMGMNPYSMYYPSPTTPGTPNTPTYGNPYANPYFFLASPLGPAPGMYGPAYMPPPLQPPPQQGQPQQRPTTDVQRQAKPKRLKAHTVTSKSFSIPMVPRDKKGQPMLPLNVGIMTVINLGIVCMREHFHTERYIFPVGYEVTRSVSLFGSTL